MPPVDGGKSVVSSSQRRRICVLLKPQLQRNQVPQGLTVVSTARLMLVEQLAYARAVQQAALDAPLAAEQRTREVMQVVTKPR